MHRIAEEGVAAHGNTNAAKLPHEDDDQRITWICASSSSWSQELQEPGEFSPP